MRRQALQRTWRRALPVEAMNRRFSRGFRLAVLILVSICLLATGLSLSSCGKAGEAVKKDDAVTICLVRHGEAESNVTGTYSRAVGTPALTEAGKTQAENLGQALSFISFDRAYASEMARAIETEKIILSKNAHPVPDIEVNAGLDEIDFGKADGMTSARVKETFGADIFGTVADGDFVSPTGGETACTFAKRYNETMNSIAGDPENVGKTLLVTGHSSAGWWLQSLWPEQCGESLKNASCTVLQYRGGQWKLLIYNETDFTDFETMYKEAAQ